MTGTIVGKPVLVANNASPVQEPSQGQIHEAARLLWPAPLVKCKTTSQNQRMRRPTVIGVRTIVTVSHMCSLDVWSCVGRRNNRLSIFSIPTTAIPSRT
ncbi:hypothetical protein SCLCIDRAFT_1219282 [Scleroderma citrinum Foug A]|uniref:Uncharacterized protein n=1 Tax=Scleroderma citrinum Foug A TaxID=1036808 RepID=A0A0C3DN26_9AGAM|nr:hypothetical protein SCLCIDRAFT_1219282 [Scleroderma citrinum Foug A]